ncbi:hypothetical protein AVEN_275665-1, partial [Araneus ventricosus]
LFCANVSPWLTKTICATETTAARPDPRPSRGLSQGPQKTLNSLESLHRTETHPDDPMRVPILRFIGDCGGL